MRGIFGIDPGWGITLLRLMTAIVFIVSGSGKWAAGLAATTAGFAKVGIPAPGIAAPFIVIRELGVEFSSSWASSRGCLACCSRWK